MGPLLLIGAGAAVVGGGMSLHGKWKQHNQKKKLEKRLEEIRALEREFKAAVARFEAAAESLGRIQVVASETCKKAAEYLHATAKQHNLKSLPQIPYDVLEEWVSLRNEIAAALGIGGSVVAGTTAFATNGIYMAAGLFGVASTGTRIATLSGAAANSARLAWIGGGALSAGGGGMALGGIILNIASKANIVTAPLSVGLGIWAEKQAHETKKDVTAKLLKLDSHEKKLRAKITDMSTAILRIQELQGSIKEINQAVQDQLSKAMALPHRNRLRRRSLRPLYRKNARYHSMRQLRRRNLRPSSRRISGCHSRCQLRRRNIRNLLGVLRSQRTLLQINRPISDFHLPHQVYLTATALRELITQPALSDDMQRRIFDK